jgi:creatinine amidohydrolase/Fe(II)-dependent formamide hydrolase-like protein
VHKATDGIWFDKLTSPEVDALDRETVLVLPTGCTEQQGPHLPVDGDTFLATLFLSEAARRARAEGIVAYLLPALPTSARANSRHSSRAQRAKWPPCIIRTLMLCLAP